ncbi:MAG: C39 family peptidase [Verrucomicrobia bacterium]|nr:C39 family peptidase [Verrucomicrobiota bacterium]
MKANLLFRMEAQPDAVSCGPTCLHAVYGFYGETLSLDEVIGSVDTLDGGGTLGVMLGLDALARGYRAKLFTYNLHIFDPTWFDPGVPDIAERLERQAEKKSDPRLREASRAYIKFVRSGGELRFEDLTSSLLRRYLRRGVPLLTGLSSTYLYRCRREIQESMEEDDIKGEPTGHFVVLCGYDKEEKRIDIADPFVPNPVATDHHYTVPIHRVLNAILLGIVTYDANVLVVEKPLRNPMGT